MNTINFINKIVMSLALLLTITASPSLYAETEEYLRIKNVGNAKYMIEANTGSPPINIMMLNSTYNSSMRRVYLGSGNTFKLQVNVTASDRTPIWYDVRRDTATNSLIVVSEYSETGADIAWELVEQKNKYEYGLYDTYTQKYAQPNSDNSRILLNANSVNSKGKRKWTLEGVSTAPLNK